MAVIKVANSLDEIYSRGYMFDMGEKGYRCSVCGKVYKKEATMRTHFDKRECHKARHIFEGTATERRLYELYKEIGAEIGGKAPMSLSAFRKRSEYTILAKFVGFCSKNKVDPAPYALYCIFTNLRNFPYKSISLATKDETLKEYRRYLLENPSVIDSEAFWEENRERLMADTGYAIRAMERAEISPQFLFSDDHIDFDEWVKGLSPLEADRLDKILSI